MSLLQPLAHVAHAAGKREVRVGAVHNAHAFPEHEVALSPRAVHAMSHVAARRIQPVLVVHVTVALTVRMQRANPFALGEVLREVRLQR